MKVKELIEILSTYNEDDLVCMETYCEVDDGYYSGIYPAILESICKYPNNPLLKNAVVLYGESSDFLNKIRKINSEEETWYNLKLV